MGFNVFFCLHGQTVGFALSPLPLAGVESEVNRIWTILGKERKGGGGRLFKSAFNSLAANYSQYVKVNATIKHGMRRNSCLMLPDVSL